MRQIWNDCEGAVLSTELLLVSSVLVAGMASGLTSVRDAVTGEFADVAHSIQNLNQSYTFGAPQSRIAQTAGSEYIDRYDPVSIPAACVTMDVVQ